ncbi:unnamed protein product [Fusarium graminearum]|uniref:RBR-type E3 ubiquitin transferase n=1 Tax=Gibberella zeae TaxID=5518 RepID=A0A2H3G7G2_GIBZA|nr:hypothetical protein FGRA07_10846 [Fusarium graminearum]CAF3528453.1 unnamed protein product [Fusarium graminearum]CAG1993018.1 unnamed protein product [Fusarium graminearum]CAG2000682.1 unnamed protein product [Fusarium graminearum]CAG2006873.1 unnamed protein product [Fusarium graminearum]
MLSREDMIGIAHPDLIDLLFRFDLQPNENLSQVSEPDLARRILLAIELADADEQVSLISRFIPEEELAAERLGTAVVQKTSHRIILDPAERKIALNEDPSGPEPKENGEDCIACAESAHGRAPCGCNYCVTCYRQIIRIGLRSQEEFPPKCCKPFDERAVALSGSPALVHLFRQMQEEVKLPIPDRVYCYQGNCAAFIPPDLKGRCPICPYKTCVDCGEKAHDGWPCAEGDALEDVWATMDANKSVNCPDCGRMIQLSEACNHMTCPCGGEFCFLCGVKRRRCSCPPYKNFHLMVPMKDRPGVKPPQFRRPPRTDVPTGQGGGDTEPLKIPQLRPKPGEKERTPRSSAYALGRVIRPLLLPQNDQAHRLDESRELRERAEAVDRQLARLEYAWRQPARRRQPAQPTATARPSARHHARGNDGGVGNENQMRRRTVNQGGVKEPLTPDMQQRSQHQGQGISEVHIQFELIVRHTETANREHHERERVLRIQEAESMFEKTASITAGRSRQTQQPQQPQQSKGQRNSKRVQRQFENIARWSADVIDKSSSMPALDALLWGTDF